MKHLRVQTEKNFEWKEHTTYVLSKVARTIGFLKYPKNFIPRKYLNDIY